MSLIGSRNAARITSKNKPFAVNGHYDGLVISSRAGTETWSSTFGPVTITAVTAASPTASVKLALKNYDGAAGCTITLQGSLTRRPD
jgi:hypothetical protein